MTPRDLLDDCDGWNAEAAKQVKRLSEWRDGLLKESRRLKMTAACKALLVMPKMGGEEPAASVAPEPYPSQQLAQADPNLDIIEALKRKA